MDILDRTDRSSHPMHSGSEKKGKSYKETYSWSELNKKMRPKSLRKHDLRLDDIYQRGGVDGNKRTVLEIAAHWDWRLLGTLLVACRSDDTYWVVDGGHRLRASFYRADVTTLPCIVFESEGPREEADIFHRVNNQSTRVSAFHTFNAQIVARDKLAIKLDRLLVKNGYEYSPSSAPAKFTALSTLVDIGKKDMALTTQVIDFLAELGGPDKDVIPADMIKGLYGLAVNQRLVKRDIFTDTTSMNKLRKLGISACMVKIRQEKALTGRGSARVCGVALMKIINKGRRKRWKWVEKEE